MAVARQYQRQGQHLLQGKLTIHRREQARHSHHRKALPHQRLNFELREFAVVEQDGEHRLAAPQLLGKMARKLLGDAKPDAGQARPAGLDQGQRQRIRNALRNRQGHFPGGAVEPVRPAEPVEPGTHRNLGVPHLLQHGARMAQKSLAAFGRGDPAAGSVQQLRTEFFFQMADLKAQRRLRDMHLRSRLRDARALDDGDEILELSQLHCNHLLRAVPRSRDDGTRVVKACRQSQPP